MKKFIESKVHTIMTRKVVTVKPDMTIDALEKMFDKHGFNMFPVVKKGNLVGVVSEFDFLKAFVIFGSDLQNPKPYKKIAKEKTVQDICATSVTFREWHPLTYVLEVMVNSKLKSFPVINDDGKLVGMLARRDVIKKLKE